MNGPRMFVATLAINTTGHYPLKESDYAWELKLPKGLQEITGADEGRRAVREQIAHGADWIKIYADRGYTQLADGSYRIMEWHSAPVEILIVNVYHGKIEIENNPAIDATVRLFFDNQKWS